MNPNQKTYYKSRKYNKKSLTLDDKVRIAVAKQSALKERKKTDWKYTDVNANSTNVQTSGSITSLLANLTRGDAGLNNFDGNIVDPQAITFKYFLHTSTIRNAVRVIIFQWFDSATPVIAGILQNSGAITATLSPILVTNKTYIKVLYDRTHQFAPTAGGDTTVTGEGVIDCQTVYIPGRKLRPVRYNSSSNVVQTGNLYLLLVSDDAAVPSPQINYYSRVTFSDS